MNILIINGPSLRQLGKREVAIYGSTTYEELVKMLFKEATKMNLQIDVRQSNHEGDIIDWILESPSEFDGIIINPAAYSHTSVAILDALKTSKLPTVEVHLSNIEEREEFRHHSFVSLYAQTVIMGKGVHGYILALHEMIKLIKGDSI